VSLTVEDGTGLAAADSYISRADADTYFSDRNNSTWSALGTGAKEAGLRYAAITLDALYEWSGEILTLTQGLSWPRVGGTDLEGRVLSSSAVPTRIKHAACELALLHASNALNASHDRGGAIVREKVGPIETEYQQGAPAEPLLPILDRLIHGIGIRRSRVSGELERA
jgi:hypothetical protein